MIHTDGNPTIAWANWTHPVDSDEVYQLLNHVHNAFVDGYYKWQPHGGGPFPIPKQPGKYKACVGVACMSTSIDGKLNSKEEKYNDNTRVSALRYIRQAVGDEASYEDLYNWNDTLNPKSAKRAVVRALRRATLQRMKDVLTRTRGVA